MVSKVWPLFIERFPEPQSIIDSNSEDIFCMVSELGLGFQRVDALQQVGLALEDQYSGKVPNSIPNLLELPHIGLYSAHAVACFAFHRKVPVVDGNVIRVFSRLTGEDYPKDNRRRRSKEVWELARSIIPSRKVFEHNYGFLDFAAQICKPVQPDCNLCPIRKHCHFGLIENQ